MHMSRTRTFQSNLAASQSNSTSFNPELAVLRMGGSMPFLTEYGQLFLRNQRRLLTRIQEAQARNDFEEIAETAGDAKNILRNLGMLGAFEIASDLQDCAAAWDLQQVQVKFYELTEELSKAEVELENWMSGDREKLETLPNRIN